MWNLILAALVGAGMDAGTKPLPPAEVMAVRVELAQMVALDQSWRRLMGPGPMPPAEQEAVRKEYERKHGDIDGKHTARLKALFKKYGGWIRATVFGRDAAHDAWLLTQHADHDRAFQKTMLPVLEAAVASRDADGVDVAYLTDRVLIADNLPQRFGTQGRCVDKGKWEAHPSAEPEKLEQRRQALGLEPSADYAKRLHGVCTRNEDLPRVAPDAGK
jgi:hypothetical protein